MLILASASPRRKELLEQAEYDFRVQPASIPEELQPGEDPVTFAVRLAREKASAVFEQRESHDDKPGDPLIVLGADTAVVCGTEVLGKPRNDDDAVRMLRLLSGRVHSVITGIAVASRLGVRSDSVSTSVTMLPISEENIAAYVAGGEPMDKAGAYAIQGYAACWIPRIEGDYFNIVGLPICRTVAMIDETCHRLGCTLMSM